MTNVTQSEFAKRKNVSRAAVTHWKNEGRLKMVGKLIDLEATEAAMIPNSSHPSKRRVPAGQAGVKLATETVKTQSPLNTEAAVYADGAIYDNPANLPSSVVDMSAAINSGASDMAFALVHDLSVDKVRSIVDAWVRNQRAGWVGGAGLSDAIADDSWPAPPLGYTRWSDHPLFTGPAVTEAEWAEAVIEAKAGA